MKQITLNYDVKEPSVVKTGTSVKQLLIMDFLASGKPYAMLNLYGRSPYATSSSFRKVINKNDELKRSVGCVCSGGNVFFIRNK